MNFHRRRTEEPEINLIPFIDVLLVVLIFLMLSTTYSRYSELQINLPTADADRLKEKPSEILVSVTGDGRYAINRSPVEGNSIEVLTAALQKAAGPAGPQAVVIVSADALSPHQSVINVMDAARRAGLPRLTFATQLPAPGSGRERPRRDGGPRPAMTGPGRTANSAPGASRPPPRSLAAWITAQWAGPRPSAGAQWLRPLSWLYGALAALHAGLYRSGLLKTQRAPVPVLVVGNLVAGGAGKTPAVIALLGLLRHQGFTPGVIARGHGRQGRGVQPVRRDSPADLVGDEPLLIHLRTGAPVVVAADRVAAARRLCADHPAVDLLVADDGLQHHRLHHDRVVLVFDERGAGNGLLLPAGPLRQRLPARVPPHTTVLYNAPRPSTPLPGCVGRRRLAGVQPLADWWAGRPLPADGGWAALPPGPLLATAGLARPEPFFRMLEAAGLAIQRLPLADHHPLQPLPWPADTPDVIVTEKDAVKLQPGHTGRARVWVAPLDFQPEPAFAQALHTLCAPLRTPHEP